MQGATVRHEENTTSKVHKYSNSKLEITDPQKATIGKLFRKISPLNLSCTKKNVFLSFISKKGDVTNVKSRLFSLTDVKALGN